MITKVKLISILQNIEICISSVLGEESTERSLGEGICKNYKSLGVCFFYIHLKKREKQTQEHHRRLWPHRTAYHGSKAELKCQF